MRTTGIVTDSHSSISQSEAEKLGIFVLPMPFYMNGTCYYEGINITREEFLDRLCRLEDISTSQPSPEAVMELWDKALSQYKDILYIPISSGLSGSCQTAMMLAQEEKFAAPRPAPLDRETRERAEDRAETLKNGGRITFSPEEVRAALGLTIRNSTTLGTGTLVEPTRVGSTIHDNVARVSSIVDQVYVQDLTGCQAILEPLLLSDMEAQTGKVTTTAGTARTASDPTFSAAKIAPYEATVTTFVDRNLSRLTPVAYEEKIRSIAMRSLRRAVAKLIYNGDGQGTPDMYGIKTAKDTAGAALFKTVNVSSIEAGFLDNIVFAYGSDEEVGGNARLFLTKADLAAIGALRNADDNRVYEIVPDPANANTGRILDGGLIVPYTIGSALTSLSASKAGASDIQTMIYGDPMNFELGLFGDYSIRIDESVKAVERMNAILGDVMVGGNLIVKDGFVVATLPKSGG